MLIFSNKVGNVITSLCLNGLFLYIVLLFVLRIVSIFLLRSLQVDLTVMVTFSPQLANFRFEVTCHKYIRTPLLCL